MSSNGTRTARRHAFRILVGTAAAQACIMLSGCSAPAGASAESAEGALFCERPIHNVGDVHQYAVSHEFLVTNVSSGPVRIAKIGKSCACAEVTCSKSELRPGESTTISMDVEIHPAKAGAIAEFGEELLVLLEGSTQPDLALRLHGRCVPAAYKLTNRVNIPAPSATGEAFEGKFEVFVNAELGVDVTGVDAGGEMPLEAELVVTEPVPGTPYQKRTVMLRGERNASTSLPAFGRVRVQTNHEDIPEVSAQVVLQKPPGEEVEITPRVIAFGIVASDHEPMTKCLLVRLPQPDEQRVEKLETSVEYLRLDRRDEDPKPGIALVDCTLDPRTAPVGAIDGEIIIEIASALAQQEIRIPVSGFIRSAEGDSD